MNDRHYMLKEILEQPLKLRELFNSIIGYEKINTNALKNITKLDINDFDRIYFSGCGTSYHAAEVGKKVFEDLLDNHFFCEISSELKYNLKFLGENSLLIVFSQSGETGDVIGLIEEAKKFNVTVLSIVNKEDSSIVKLSDDYIYCNAGEELSIASTKVYTCQLLCIYLLALYFAKNLNKLSDVKLIRYLDELSKLPSKIDEVLTNIDEYKIIAKHIKKFNNTIFLGRGLDFTTSKEGALKLRETCYINSLSLPAGEFKHGSLALIEKGTPIICISSQKNLLDQIAIDVKEAADIGAFIVAISPYMNSKLKNYVKKWIKIPCTFNIFYPILSIIPQQLLAYYTSYELGNNVDNPRNLVKSVISE